MGVGGQFMGVGGQLEVPMDTGPIIQCAQCGGAIVAPEWSEHRSERCIRNVWSCEACGYQFEHTAYLSAVELVDADCRKSAAAQPCSASPP